MTDHESGPAPRVLVLGPVALAGAERPEAFRGQQGRVLALLVAAHPDPVTVDTLCDELWPENPPKDPRTSLGVVIHRLRARFDDHDHEIVQNDASGYRLGLSDDDFDHLAFASLVERATAALPSAPERAIADLRAALDLWRGDAFQPYTGSARLLLPSEELAEARRLAEEALVDAYLASGMNDAAAARATRLTQQEPYREGRWCQLMLALYRQDRQAEALTASQQVSAMLRDELGVEPSRALLDLEADILNQAPHLTLADQRSDGDPGADTRVADTTSGAHRIPRPDDRFFGRDDDEEHLGNLLGENRLVTLAGPAGVGKSRLASQYAAGTPDRRVLWLDLETLDGGAIEVELARALGVRAGDHIDDAARSVSETPTLLVLDTAEHIVVEVADFAERLLTQTDDLSILVTSRRPLTTRSERQLQLEPLDTEDAVRLLVDRAPLGSPVAEEAELAQIVVDRLDRLPLQIELVAPHLGVLEHDELLAQLDESPELFAAHGRGDRHRSVDAAIDWSLDLVDAADRELHEIVGVMHGTFGPAEIAELTDKPVADVRQALGRLARQALLQPSRANGATSYQQLLSIRSHARRRLDERGQLDHWQRRHAHMYADLVTRVAPSLLDRGEADAVATFARSGDQLRAAHRWLCANGDVQRSAEMTVGLWEYHFFRQEFGRFGWLEDTLALDGAEHLPNAHWLTATAGLAAWALNDFDLALRRAEQAEQRAEEMDEPVPLNALRARFNVAVQNDDIGNAFDLLNKLLKASRTQEEDRYLSDVLVNLAMGQVQAGMTEEATESAHRSLDIARRTENPTSIAWAQVALGSVELVDDPVRAAGTLRSSAHLAHTVSNRWVEGMALAGLVTALRRLGRLNQASDTLHDVIGLWDRSGSLANLLRACQEAVLVLDAQGATDAAARVLVHIDLSNRSYPLLTEDNDRYAEAAKRLRDHDVTVDFSPTTEGLARAVQAELRGHNS
ncbi:MAG: BTAD domain-containing putative transcriptional regulator [Actinomycetota bacterium]